MKVILLGSTGFIGKEVLAHCLHNPTITSLIALSRRDLPEAAENTKLSVIIVRDFRSYPRSALEHLADADACIWSIGTYNWDPEVELEYPEAFQQALSKVLNDKKTFRYIYLGGAFTEADQEKTLWFYTQGRRVRGLAETKFLEFAEQNQSVESYVVKPAAVLAKDGSATALLEFLFGTMVVRVDQLGAVMTDLAVNGGSEQVVLNKVIVERGRALLKQR